MKSGGLIYFDLNKKGTNGHKKHVHSITIFGITLKRDSWVLIAIILLLLVLAALVILPHRWKDEQIARLQSGYKVYAAVEEREHTFSDPRAEKVYKFLKEYNSPLAPYAELIVSEADANGIPYTLVPAIAGKESTFGRHIQEGSFNAWGVMAWDKAGNRSIRVFSSWQDGIAFEAKLLGDNYMTDMVGGIQTRYCPSFECSNTWTNDVTGFAEEMK